MRSRCLAGRHDLARILVAQLVEREAAACGDLRARREERRGIDPREPAALAQVPLAVAMERVARVGHRRAEADRGQRVLQAAACAHVHVHIAARNERQACPPADPREDGEPCRIIALAQQFDGEPGVAGKALADPPGHRQEVRLVRQVSRRQPQHEAALEDCIDIVEAEVIAALLRRAPPARDQATKAPIAMPVGRERDERETAAQAKPRADDQRQSIRLRRQMRAHDTRDRALVGDRERTVAERVGAIDEFARVRGAPQEGEVREAVQLGVGRRRGTGTRPGCGRPSPASPRFLRNCAHPPSSPPASRDRAPECSAR